MIYVRIIGAANDDMAFIIFYVIFCHVGMVLVAAAVVMLVAIGVVTVFTIWSSHYSHYYLNCQR